MKAKKMNAMVVTGYGSSEVLKYATVHIPTPGDDEVLVKVLASSATTADTMMLTGKPYIGRLFTGLKRPKHPVPGTGFSGIVSATGKNVRKFHPGDEVFGETTLGFSTNAEYVAVPEGGVILHKPENIDFATAAPICDGHLTSLNFLKDIAGIKPGQNVLIIGASGSLGSAAVQLAKFFGARVTGVCSTPNVSLVKSLGADKVIDYTRENIAAAGEKYDIIYDTVGKYSFGAAKSILKKAGVYMSPVLNFSLLLQMLRTKVSGGKKAIFAASGLKSDEALREMLAELSEMFLEGRLKTIIDRQFPLEKLPQAYAYIAKGHKKGNVVMMHVA